MAIFITSKEALELFGSLPEVLQAYISNRAGNHGIPPHELLRQVHESNRDNPIEIYKYLRSKHISHKIAVSEGGSSSEIKNWIFEDGSANMSRQADPMQLQEYLDAQLDNYNDAQQIDFGTPDPGSTGYNEAFAQAFNESPEQAVNMDSFIETLSGPGVSKNLIKPGQTIEIGAMDATEQLWGGLGESLAEVGIPFTYIAMRGFGGVLPFMRSINWKRFREEGQYRQTTLVRALKIFRENGWKAAAKSVVVGFLIAAFPPLSFFIAAVGLTGVAAMGTRWLANKCLKFSGPVAFALNAIADSLAKAHEFLKRVLNGLEKVVEVVIETATKTTKKIVKAGSDFARAVYEVSNEIANSAIKEGAKTFEKITHTTKQLANRVSNWIFSWFCSPSYG